MVQVQKFGTGTRYNLEILQKCDRRVEIKSEKVLEANSYVFRSYKGKSSKEPFCPPSWIESKDIFVVFFFERNLLQWMTKFVDLLTKEKQLRMNGEKFYAVYL